ncbi:MAG: DUF4334 domain-containing protein [Chloroflexota bacterium]
MDRQKPLKPIRNSEDALTFFDSLNPVDTDFMLGAWQGSGVETDHPMDGLLELANWHGKQFESLEAVHPLVHVTLGGTKFTVQPAFMPLGLVLRYPGIKKVVTKRIFLLCKPLIQTRHPAARLRMTEYRGVVSATMIYNRLPINDIFRQIDAHSVLGAMDMKGMDHPFFFKLIRENS